MTVPKQIVINCAPWNVSFLVKINMIVVALEDGKVHTVKHVC